MKKALDTYNFTQTIRVEELNDSGGKLTVSGEVYTRPDGGRFWRVTASPYQLEVRAVSLEEVRMMVGFPAFSLTTDEIGNYNFLYAGQDKLDELNTYVFQVKPKQLSRTRRFFEGAIWVDDHDLTIVKTYGKFVSELKAPAMELGCRLRCSKPIGKISRKNTGFPPIPIPTTTSTGPTTTSSTCAW